MTVEKLITDHIDIWSSALQTRSTAGRGSNGKIDLYGIKKLRELILELAVRGKLVPQDPNDEPASELLKRIAAEKAELVKQGKIKKQKPLLEISEDEKPFELPVGWEWVRMDHVGHDWGQKTPENDFTYIDVGSINKELGIVAEPTIMQAQDAPSRARKIVRRNTVVYSTVRPYLLNIAVINEDFQPEPIASTAFAIVHPWEGISATFIYHYLRSPVFINYVESCQTGVAYPAINDKQFFAGVVAIPPLEEQLRIVDKVNELMSLCDQLEQQSLSSLDAHQQLVETLLTTLTDSQNAEELADNWARISQHFDTLFTTEASIDALKQTILQLAVMGKLVPQDPNDEPASELLKRIEQEKVQQVKEGKIKKQKPLPLVSEEEKPFELPMGWEWCRTEDIGDLKLGRQRSPKDHHGPHMTPYLRVANVHDNEIRADDVKFMNFTPEEKVIFSLQYGDILLNEGQSLELVGRPAIFKNEITGACFQNTLIRFRVNKFISNEYALAYFRHCLYSGRFQKAATQTTNIAHLSVSRLAPIEFPLPSYSEQLKIVLKIKELEVLCEKIKIGVKSAQQTQLHLADALTDAALN
ncbi:restriction endonuclease subunit S [Enterobacter roggenkampii]|uniref:restriction endonuclease subunit S n=1 Tax=Enterobacter cloacae complex TaxID=354276 RepID=UPI000F8393B9|nr:MULTISPECIES: restriction endonuclease subunit S [Enterobacter cloacae complex]BBS38136.1 type I restriction endonuclease EcoAI subunit S [Enterobacter cloacae]RTY02395.1 restriction endonuclease subunit S [Enterobacter roggenkampii]RTY37500.1 restriction endonuclease subunit S [Enterobacter roggenkampii]WNS31892.1 restriction endonuclease subunit S [Enterobacter asburiae]BBT45848.1 type I restriction endonuclease EcoAI subunit S [Enterobacter cloacae]